MRHMVPLLAALGCVVSLAGGPLSAQESRKLPETSALCRVQGRLLDDAGRPVAGAGITVGAAPELLTADALQRPVTKSREDGTFVVDIPAQAKDAPHPSVGILVAKAGMAALCWNRFPDALTHLAPRTAAPEAHDLGALRLCGGTDVRGRVRGEGGKPLANARITAIDLLSLRDPFAARFNTACLSDADGTFVLRSVRTTGVLVHARADGHFDRVLTFSPGEPLVLELQRSGFFSGRVLDEDDQPVRAVVALETEAGALVPSAVGMWRTGSHFAGAQYCHDAAATDEGGRFRITRRFPGLSRLHTRPVGAPWTMATGLLEEPRDEMVIRVACSRKLVFQVVEHETGKPIPQARAAVLWDQSDVFIAQVNQSSLPACFANTAQGADREGRIRMWTTPGAKSSAGLYRLDAPGFGSIPVGSFTWDCVGKPEYELRLTKESVIEGEVVDEDTGEPLAGALVRCRARPATLGTLKYRADAEEIVATCVTDAKGLFRIGSLGAENYEVDAVVAGRPPIRLQSVPLQVEDTRSVTLVVPKGVTLSGKLAGGTLPAGSWLELGLEVPRPAGRTDPWFRPAGVAHPAADGSFSAPCLGPGNYRVVVKTSVPGSQGPALSAELTQLEVGTKDMTVELDVSPILPAGARGKVTVVKGECPKGRLMVFFLPQEEPRRTRAVFQMLGPDGRFDVLLPKGSHLAHVLDAVSGVVVFVDKEPLALAAGARVTRDLELSLAHVDLELVSGGEWPPLAQGVRIQASIENTLPWFGTSTVFMADGARGASLCVPPGDVLLDGVLGFGPGGDKLYVIGTLATWDYSLGEVGLEAVAGKPARTKLVVGARPEVGEHLREKAGR